MNAVANMRTLNEEDRDLLCAEFDEFFLWFDKDLIIFGHIFPNCVEIPDILVPMILSVLFVADLLRSVSIFFTCIFRLIIVSFCVDLSQFLDFSADYNLCSS